MRGATINGKHTFTDFGLKMVEPLEISPPEPKTKYVDIPGAKYPLDATESLYGSVTYKNRTVTMNFFTAQTYSQWLNLDSRLQNAFAGKSVQLTLDIEPDKYWIGRTKSIESKRMNSRLTSYQFIVEVQPFKYFYEEPSDEWLWNPFSFRDGVIQNLRNITVSGTKTQTIQGTQVASTPTCTATANMTVSADGQTFQLEANVPKELTGVVIYQTAKTLTFTGNGKVTITFRGETL